MAAEAQQSRRLPPMRRLSIQAAVSATHHPNRIAANVEYFDAILSLMPPSVYFGPDDDAKEAGWSKFSRNKQERAPEQKRKESSKAAKRLARFDPEKAAEATVPGMVASREAEQKRKDRDAVAAFGGGAAASGTAAGGKAKKEGEEKVSGWFGDLEAGAGSKKRRRSPDDSDDSDADDGEEDEDEGAGEGARGGRGASAGVPAEYRPKADMSELKEILQAKIAAMKAAREGKEGGKSDRKRLKEAARAAAIEKAKQAGGKDKALKAPAAGQPAASKPQQAGGKDKPAKTVPAVKPSAPVQGKAALAASSSSAGHSHTSHMDVDMEGSLSFGAIDTALPAALAAATVSTRDTLPAAALGGAGHGQAGGKTGKLKELLHDARKYQKRLHALEQAGQTDQKLSMEFDHALRRAEGEKVRDDPKLIEKMLKRKQKEKAGSAQEWQDRVKKEKEEGKARQEERSENVKNKRNRQAKRSERPDGDASGGDKSGKGGKQPFGGKPAYGKPGGSKADKQARRPGFEGRKTGFID